MKCLRWPKAAKHTNNNTIPTTINLEGTTIILEGTKLSIGKGTMLILEGTTLIVARKADAKMAAAAESHQRASHRKREHSIICFLVAGRCGRMRRVFCQALSNQGGLNLLGQTCIFASQALKLPPSHVQWELFKGWIAPLSTSENVSWILQLLLLWPIDFVATFLILSISQGTAFLVTTLGPVIRLQVPCATNAPNAPEKTVRIRGEKRTYSWISSAYISMKMDSKSPGDVSHWTHVYRKQERIHHRSPRNYTEVSWFRIGLPDRVYTNPLRPARYMYMTWLRLASSSLSIL